jgi:peroxiredoxin
MCAMPFSVRVVSIFGLTYGRQVRRSPCWRRRIIQASPLSPFLHLYLSRSLSMSLNRKKIELFQQLRFLNPFMNKKITLSVVTSFIATAIFALEPPPVGSAAPDFSLTDAKGQTHSLSQYKGKYVVLEWFNPECPFVKKHYGSDNMQKLQKEYTGKGVVWLTIDSNAPGTQGNLTPEQAQKVATSWKTQQTALLLDPDGKVGRAYGAKNTPNMVIIDPEGKIAYEGAIDSKATPNPADIPSSTNYVKAALDQSLAGKSISTRQTKPYGCSVKYKSS